MHLLFSLSLPSLNFTSDSLFSFCARLCTDRTHTDYWRKVKNWCQFATPRTNQIEVYWSTETIPIKVSLPQAKSKRNWNQLYFPKTVHQHSKTSKSNSLSNLTMSTTLDQPAVSHWYSWRPRNPMHWIPSWRWMWSHWIAYSWGRSIWRMQLFWKILLRCIPLDGLHGREYSFGNLTLRYYCFISWMVGVSLSRLFFIFYFLGDCRSRVRFRLSIHRCQWWLQTKITIPYAFLYIIIPKMIIISLPTNLLYNFS